MIYRLDVIRLDYMPGFDKTGGCRSYYFTKATNVKKKIDSYVNYYNYKDFEFLVLECCEGEEVFDYCDSGCKYDQELEKEKENEND